MWRLDKTQIKTKQASTWKNREIASQNTAFLVQKAQNLDIFMAILCQRNCHTDAGTSCGVPKMETRVRRTYTNFLRALNRPKWSSGGRDMIICLTDGLMTVLRGKGLIRPSDYSTYITRVLR